MRLFLSLLTTLLFSLLAMAQHGAAHSGNYPENYQMETWTGKLLAYNPETHEMRLQCDLCADKQEFSAIIGDPEASKVIKFKVAPRDMYQRRVAGEPRKLAPDTITLGDILRVYYITHSKKQDGAKVKYNAVFEMEMLVSAAPLPEQAAVEPGRPDAPPDAPQEQPNARK